MEFTVLLMLFLAELFCSIAVGEISNTNKHKSSQIYSFGGATKQPSQLSSASYFSSSTGKWLPTTEMGIAKQTFCGAVVGTKVYLFGGFKSDYGSFKTAEVYDCETGTYNQFRSLIIKRSGCGAAVLGDFIYVAAGWDNGNTLSSVVRYNLHTTRMEQVSSMHVPRSSFQLVQLRGRLYAIGGSTKIVEVYNPTTDRWSIVASTLYEHSFFGATVHERRIYVCSRQGCEVYSPDIDKWTTFTSLNYGNSALVSMNGKLWAIGGAPSGKPATKSVFTYDTFTEKWTQQPDMDVPRVGHASFVVYQ